MIQFIIAGMIALALVGSIWKFGDHMADARELEVREAYAQKAEAQRKEAEAREAMLREWALQLSRNYLSFGKAQERFFTGVKDDLVATIANDPNLRRACFDALGVSRFNGDAAEAGGRTGAAPGSHDGGVRREAPTPSR